jgi:hypothetical protein
MKKTIIDDGFNAELVAKAFFDGHLEFPHIEKPHRIIIPQSLVPYSSRHQGNGENEFIHFYEHDKRFFDLLTATKKHLPELKRYDGVISPDCSLYRDMPLCLQIAHTYMNRAIAHYLQTEGIYVIPNVRWGDERSYTTHTLPEKFAFLGLEKHSIVSIGTYGCIQSPENKYYFREGLKSMLEELEPAVVLVYGAMPDSVFAPFKGYTQFVNFQDWTTLKKRGAQ